MQVSELKNDFLSAQNPKYCHFRPKWPKIDTGPTKKYFSAYFFIFSLNPPKRGAFQDHFDYRRRKNGHREGIETYRTVSAKKVDFRPMIFCFDMAVAPRGVVKKLIPTPNRIQRPLFDQKQV